jgi:hypothetical protein
MCQLQNLVVGILPQTRRRRPPRRPSKSDDIKVEISEFEEKL